MIVQFMGPRAAVGLFAAGLVLFTACLGMGVQPGKRFARRGQLLIR